MEASDSQRRRERIGAQPAEAELVGSRAIELVRVNRTSTSPTDDIQRRYRSVGMSAERENPGPRYTTAAAKADNGQMGTARAAAIQWVKNLLSRRGPARPPDAGVREPRRPRPTLPSAAIALAEPRTEVRRWIRLTNRRDSGET